jgi:hypothetical protein
MQSPKRTLISSSLHIAEKQETDGNESGNGAETRAGFLCRSGNELETKGGNENQLSVALVSSTSK